MSTLSLNTRLLHAGTPDFDANTHTAPVGVPVTRTSTVRFRNTAAYGEVHQRRGAGERIASYGRQGGATHHALEDAVNALEGGNRTFLVPSGLAGISLAFLALLSPGDHALVTDSVYTPVRRLQHNVLQRLGIELSYFSPSRDKLEDHLRPNTRLVYLESPGSLLMEVLDLPALAAKARAHGAVVVADNTWATGYLYQPLALGAQVSVLAGTKYISGHSDLLLGTVTTNDDAVARRLAAYNDSTGLTISADDASLALRGVRTLPIRLAQHARHALEVAQFLEQHPAVARVYYPALPSDPGHALWQRDFSGANGLLAIELAHHDRAAALRFVDELALFGIGASWGGYESLVQPVDPARLAEHSYWQGGDHPVVRLHIGLETPADLIADLDRALTVSASGGALRVA